MKPRTLERISTPLPLAIFPWTKLHTEVALIFIFQGNSVERGMNFAFSAAIKDYLASKGHAERWCFERTHWIDTSEDFLQRHDLYIIFSLCDHRSYFHLCIGSIIVSWQSHRRLELAFGGLPASDPGFHYSFKPVLLKQMLANHFYKGSDNHYFRLSKPY